jgi:hypothetical protein
VCVCVHSAVQLICSNSCAGFHGVGVFGWVFVHKRLPIGSKDHLHVPTYI